MFYHCRSENVMLLLMPCYKVSLIKIYGFYLVDLQLIDHAKSAELLISLFTPCANFLHTQDI